MRTHKLAVALGVVALTACTKGEGAAGDSTRATDTVAAHAVTTSTAPTAGAPATKDPAIAAVLDEVNVADSTFGRIASTKGTNPDVRSFGVMMMNDHHALRAAGRDLFARLGVSPTPPPGDSMPVKIQQVTDSLNVLAKGAPFDRGYIADEISNHRTVLGFIDNAMGQTQNAEVKALLAKARPNVEMHLKRAQEIEGKLGSGATP